MQVYKGNRLDNYMSSLVVVSDDGRHTKIEVSGSDYYKVTHMVEYLEYCLKETWINDPDVGVL